MVLRKNTKWIGMIQTKLLTFLDMIQVCNQLRNLSSRQPQTILPHSSILRRRIIMLAFVSSSTSNQCTTRHQTSMAGRLIAFCLKVPHISTLSPPFTRFLFTQTSIYANLVLVPFLCLHINSPLIRLFCVKIYSSQFCLRIFSIYAVFLG